MMDGPRFEDLRARKYVRGKSPRGFIEAFGDGVAGVGGGGGGWSLWRRIFAENKLKEICKWDFQANPNALKVTIQFVLSAIFPLASNPGVIHAFLAKTDFKDF